MKLGIGSDHAGFAYKGKLIALLRKKGYEVVDFGTDSPASVDYPDIAHPLAKAVENGTVDAGIALCGTGNGMALTLNKHQGIRAGLAWNSEIARLVKAHNNAQRAGHAGALHLLRHGHPHRQHLAYHCL